MCSFIMYILYMLYFFFLKIKHNMLRKQPIPETEKETGSYWIFVGGLWPCEFLDQLSIGRSIISSFPVRTFLFVSSCFYSHYMISCRYMIHCPPQIWEIMTLHNDLTYLTTGIVPRVLSQSCIKIRVSGFRWWVCTPWMFKHSNKKR